jgi:hypothetical protein
MSINQLKTEVAEVYKQVKEAETRREALAVELEPVIDSYFTVRIRKEQNPELRRDFAYLNAAKRFELLDEATIRFSARNMSGPIKHDVAVSDLIDEYVLPES